MAVMNVSLSCNIIRYVDIYLIDLPILMEKYVLVLHIMTTEVIAVDNAS